MITSSTNSKIKLVRKLHSQSHDRKGETAFVIEGVRLIEEAISVGWPIEFILFDQTLSSYGQSLIAQQHNPYEITPGLMADISDTETSQGILAVLPRNFRSLPAIPDVVILIDQVRDPGNMGTMLRSAAAIAASAVILTPGTVDVYSPKVIRAGMGAHFHLPILPLPWHEIHTYLNKLPIFLAAANANMTLWQANFRQPCVLLIGGEAFGASRMGEEMATHQVSIPMPGRVESLNAAVAAGIIMAEVMRQRFVSGKEN